MVQTGLTQCVAVGRLSVGAAGAIRRPGGWLPGLLHVMAEFQEQQGMTAPGSKYLSSLCSATFATSWAKPWHRPAQIPGVEKDLLLD